MDSEDNASFTGNNLNGSFGREVLGASRPKELQYLDSSTASSVDGAEGVDMDDYLDEALEDDEFSHEYNPMVRRAESKNKIKLYFKNILIILLVWFGFAEEGQFNFIEQFFIWETSDEL